MSGYTGRIIGGTIGFIASGGNPAGFQAGWTIGSLADGPQGEDQQGPRLGDLSVQSAAFGRFIPITYGTTRLSGNVIWSKPLKETSHKESQGKGGGGGSVETFTYAADFALGLCEGEIDGVRRIWADAKLIYNAGDNASVEDVVASNQAAGGFTLYTGTETQDPDPLIQSDKGAANTPAYRGLAYIVFSDLQLADFGNRIPNLTVEVVNSGSQSVVKADQFDMKTAATTGAGTSALYMSGLYNESLLCLGHPAFSSNGIVILYNYFQDGSYQVARRIDITSLGTLSSQAPQGWSDVPAFIAHASTSKTELWVFSEDMRRLTRSRTLIDVTGQSVVIAPGYNTSSHYIRDGYWYIFCYQAGSDMPIYKTKVGSGLNDPIPTATTLTIKTYPDGDAHDIFVTEDSIYVLLTNDSIDILDLEGGFQSNISFSPSPSLDYVKFGAGETLVRVDNGIIYLLSESSDEIDVHQIQNGVYSYLGQAVDGFNYERTGGMHIEDGVMYTYRPAAVGGSVDNDDYVTHQLYGLSSSGVSLSSVQSDICDRAGLSSSDYDVTALSETVEGYAISRVMSGRAASEPLMQAFLYDAVEKSNKITFIHRGGSSVASVPETDLGASVSGSTPLFTHTRRQEAELPSRVVINYTDKDNDHQEGTQSAQRINAITDTVSLINLPIVMSADYAKQLSEIILYNTWTERDKYLIPLSSEYIDLNPADIITFTANGVETLARITDISFGNVLEVSCVKEDAESYDSTATAGDTVSVSQSIGLIPPTVIEIMDIPILRNQDDNAGMYVAAAGYTDSWSGAEVFKSLDSGASYNSLVSVFNASVMGLSSQVLSDHVTTKWDRTNSVKVTMTNGAPESMTEAQVLQGANYALLGDEIIQFVNATLESDGRYTLDTFIRGRRGTEWATGTHEAYERLVLLDVESVRRFDATVSVSRDYKAVSYGNFIEDAAQLTITNSGASQKPFSPAIVKGNRNSSSDLTISWKRRSRYINTPLWSLILFEETESYEIDIMDGATVARTITSSSESAIYTSAQQVADFGSNQSSVTIKIYQISASVGRGFEREVTL